MEVSRKIACVGVVYDDTLFEFCVSIQTLTTDIVEMQETQLQQTGQLPK